MTSSLPDLNEFPVSPSFHLLVQPQSPLNNWPGLDDLSSDSSGIPFTQNPTLGHDEEVEQPIGVPDLNQAPAGQRKELSKFERLAAYEMLLEKSKDGMLRRRATSEVAVSFGVGIRSIQRLWKRARESGSNDHSNGRVTNCGRKRVNFNLERIRDIPLRQRTTLSSLAFALGVSRTHLYMKLKERVIRRHTNAIHPSLTAENRTSRINHCLSSFDPATVPLEPTFTMMDNIVHIDEKWFYLTRRSETYYLLHDEIDPVRTIKSSNFIPKVMFLSAVARPRYDSNGLCTFDGKIGVFPLVEHVAAVRSSRNRPRGTIEVKPITNITRNVIKEFMIGSVLPAIANKWPRESIRDRIFIQQDNAKTHIHVDDIEFFNVVQESGMNVSLVCQPPNSPDLNVLDLDFFRAIQSLQSKECAKSVQELVAAVEKTYQEFEVKKSNHIFLTLQSCMIEILKCYGSNTYNIPHLKKNQLEIQGTLLSRLQCCPEVYANALARVSP